MDLPFVVVVSAGALAVLGVLLVLALARLPVIELAPIAASSLSQVEGARENAPPASVADQEEVRAPQAQSDGAAGVREEMPLGTGTLQRPRYAAPAEAANDRHDVAPLQRAEPEGVWFTMGSSVQGRPIRALRLGSGPVGLALMGSIHGGWERNTERLVQRAYEHFLANLDEIPHAMSLYILPTTNPDGLAAGSDRDSAWNARGVDLNRNFDTPNWSRDTYGRVGGRYGPSGTRRGGGGTAPFSEPETQAIRDFILRNSISTVMSYHSGIVSVTAKDGGGGLAELFALRVGQITGYPYIATWTEYPLTGQFMDWLDAAGVKGIEIDLPNQQTIDWPQNLAAIKAIIAALSPL